MISLKKTLDQIEDNEQRYAAALGCFAGAIRSMESNSLHIHEDLDYTHRLQLRKLHRRIQGEPQSEALRACGRDLESELRGYGAKANQVLARKDHEIKRIIRTLADAAGTLTVHNERHASRLGGFTRQLESIARLDDLSEVRRKLAEEVRGLKSCLEEIRRESQASVQQLRQDLEGFQQRLSQAETLAITDRLTGIANRVEGEKRLEECIRSGGLLSILLFDLDDFKTVNDRFGHQAGDTVLKSFARRLANSVRPTDTVCRWGGDEFLVILPGCGLRGAMARAEELGDICAGEYNVSFDGRPMSVKVRASIGTAEHQQGESSEAFFHRADKFLYREKEAGLLEVIGADYKGS